MTATDVASAVASVLEQLEMGSADDDTLDQIRRGPRSSGVVRVAGRVLVPPELVSPLLEGLRVGSGEVVVRAAGRTSRIFLARGAIAWVVSDEVPYRLSHVLETMASIPRATMRPIVEECRRTGANFGETLLKRGLVDTATLRHCMLQHNAHHFLGLLRLGDEIDASFTPRNRSYGSELLFDVPELLEAVARLMGSVPAPVPELLGSLQELGESVRGCRALVALSSETSSSSRSTVLAAWPAAALEVGPSLEVGRATADLLDGSVAHAVLGGDERLLPSVDPGEIREIVLMDEHGFRVLLRTPDRPQLALLAVVDGSSNLGLVLSRLRAGLRTVAWPS